MPRRGALRCGPRRRVSSGRAPRLDRGAAPARPGVVRWGLARVRRFERPQRPRDQSQRSPAAGVACWRFGGCFLVRSAWTASYLLFDLSPSSSRISLCATLSASTYQQGEVSGRSQAESAALSTSSFRSTPQCEKTNCRRTRKPWLLRVLRELVMSAIADVAVCTPFLRCCMRDWLSVQMSSRRLPGGSRGSSLCRY